MNKKNLIALLILCLFIINSSVQAEQKQYLQVAKEKEIKERQIRQEQERERSQRFMDRVYGDRNPYIEFKADYNPDEIPRECWGGPCRE